MKIGVIIGRFQVPSLHEGHVELIKYVQSRHDQVMIMLGVSPVVGSARNPLDYITREKMIRERFPTVAVMPIMDQPTNELWSEILDATVRSVCPVGEVILYGGRESFIPLYSGRFKTVEIDTIQSSATGTDIREITANKILVTSDFRAGVIYATKNQFPRVFKTVDMALIFGDEIVLGKKKNSPFLCFPGGFVDQEDISLEEAAKRESVEETGLMPLDPVYVGSLRSSDWRYRHREDGIIMTSVFVCHAPFIQGTLKAADDLDSVQKIPLSSLKEEMLIDCHRPIFRLVMEKTQPKEVKIVTGEKHG